MREEKIQTHLMSKIMTGTDPVYRRLVAMTAVDIQCVSSEIRPAPSIIDTSLKSQIIM